MREVTVGELRDIINGIVTCQPVSADIVVDPRWRYKNHPEGIKKHETMSGLIGFRYANSVNNQLGREDKPLDFQPQARKWGTLEGNLVYHKEKVYLQFKVQSCSTPVYMDGDTVVPKSQIEDALRASRKPHTQSNLDKEVVVRDVNLDNIKCIRMLGEEYNVVQVHTVEYERQLEEERIAAEEEEARLDAMPVDPDGIGGLF